MPKRRLLEFMALIKRYVKVSKIQRLIIRISKRWIVRFNFEGGYFEELKCTFCTLDPARIIATNKHAIAVFDGFPISPGHTLIIPKRHIATLFETTTEELIALFNILSHARKHLVQKQNPGGFNIGVNDGVAAGQTVMHLHIHLIPRYAGDMPDPRGGIRWIFPDKAEYWEK